MTPAERLAWRRELLIVQSRAQRLRLQATVRDVGGAARPAAWLARLAVRLREHPTWVVAIGAGVVALRRIGVRRALAAWRLWRAMSA